MNLELLVEVPALAKQRIVKPVPSRPFGQKLRMPAKNFTDAPDSCRDMATATTQATHHS